MSIADAITFCQEKDICLVARPRGYGYALYGEGFEPFPGGEKRRISAGRPDMVWTRRFGGFEGTPPEEASARPLLSERDWFYE